MYKYCCLQCFLLTLLLSGLVKAQTAKITGTVSDEFGNLPGAKVVLEGTIYNTFTDVDGSFMLEVDPGSYTLISSFVMYLSDIREIKLNASDSVHFSIILPSGFSVDQLVTLGSRAKPRSLLETNAPIDVISPQQITNSSQIELSHILHYLTPSFHSVLQTVSDGTDFVDPGTLRGLGPDQVLVLVNGKRRHNSSLLNVNGTVGRGTVGTDFNAIPVAAVDRIEILRDGAASQYGSDAIAGVINIVLKDKTGIIDVDTHIGGNTFGDGFTQYSSANYGLRIGDKGFINLTAEYRNRASSNRSGDYTGAVYSSDPTIDAKMIAENRFFEQNHFTERRVMEVGNAATQNLGFFFNSEVVLSKDATFYGHGGRNFREGKSRGFYRFPSDTQRVVQELFPNGFSPEILTNIQDKSLVLGVRGMRSHWKLDFSISSGSNKLDYTVRNSNNASMGMASPKVFYAGGFNYAQNTTNLDISRTFNWLKGVNIAFGTEARTENYQIIAGEEASWLDGGDFVISNSGDTVVRVAGAQVFPGFQPENELNKFRTNVAWYFDIETNISERLLIEVASRYQLYNDFEGQIIGKVAARYKVKDKFNLRGGLATGFRAPSLHQVYFNNISTQFENGDAVQVGTFNNESAVTNAFKIGRLKPELSRHLSAGFTTKLFGSFTFTFDYYQINIKDRIVLSGKFDEGYETTLDPLGVGAAQFFTNAIDSRTTGADAVAFYKQKIGKGSLETSVAANITSTRLLGQIKVSPELIGQEEVLYNREEVSRVESAQPSFKINSVISYKKGRIYTELRNTMFGKVKYVHPDDANKSNWKVDQVSGQTKSRDQVFSPKLTTDLMFSFQINDHLKFSVGGNNIFNVYPDKHVHSENLDHGNFIYSRRVQQFGVRGAYYYSRLLLSL